MSKLPKWVPGPAEMVREGIIVVGGVIIAAAAVQLLGKAFPKFKAWLKEQLPTT